MRFAPCPYEHICVLHLIIFGFPNKLPKFSQEYIAKFYWYYVVQNFFPIQIPNEKLNQTSIRNENFSYFQTILFYKVFPTFSVFKFNLSIIFWATKFLVRSLSIIIQEKYQLHPLRFGHILDGPLHLWKILLRPPTFQSMYHLHPLR